MPQHKNIGYFQHHFPMNYSVLSYYDDALKISYNGSFIDFKKKDSFVFSSEALLALNADSISYSAEQIIIHSKKTISIAIKKTIKVSAEKISLKQGVATIVINDSGITLSASKITLNTPEFSQVTGVACEGDAHICPQANGPALHVGGVILQGSKNVLLENRGIARHGDAASCVGAKNQLNCKFSSITVNGQPIAYELANTVHQGKVTTSSHLLNLAPYAFVDAKAFTVEKIPLLNELHVCLDHADKTTLMIRTPVKNRSVKFTNEVALINDLTIDELTGKLQITIK